MTTETSATGESGPPSKVAVWVGRIISALVVAMMLMASTMSLSGSQQAIEGLKKMGYPEGAGFGIGLALLVSTVLYAVPRTSVLGAILLTGYLGGAVATHVRVSEGFVPAIIFGVLTWLGLLLRNRKVRELLPVTR